MSYERSDVDPLGGAVSVRAVRCVCVCAGGTGTVYGTPRVRCSSRVARTFRPRGGAGRGRLARAAGRCARALSAGTRELPSPSRMHRASHRRTATGCAAAPARRRVVPVTACGGTCACTVHRIRSS